MLDLKFKVAGENIRQLSLHNARIKRPVVFVPGI